MDNKTKVLYSLPLFLFLSLSICHADLYSSTDKSFLFILVFTVLTIVMLVLAFETQSLGVGVMAFVLAILDGAIILTTDTSAYLGLTYAQGLASTIMLIGVLVPFAIFFDMAQKKE